MAGLRPAPCAPCPWPGGPSHERTWGPALLQQVSHSLVARDRPRAPGARHSCRRPAHAGLTRQPGTRRRRERPVAARRPRSRLRRPRCRLQRGLSQRCCRRLRASLCQGCQQRLLLRCQLGRRSRHLSIQRCHLLLPQAGIWPPTSGCRMAWHSSWLNVLSLLLGLCRSGRARRGCFSPWLAPSASRGSCRTSTAAPPGPLAAVCRCGRHTLAQEWLWPLAGSGLQRGQRVLRQAALRHRRRRLCLHRGLDCCQRCSPSAMLQPTIRSIRGRLRGSCQRCFPGLSALAPGCQLPLSNGTLTLQRLPIGCENRYFYRHCRRPRHCCADPMPLSSCCPVHWRSRSCCCWQRRL